MSSFKSRYGQIFVSMAFVFLSVSGFGVFGATPSEESGSDSNGSPTSGAYSFAHQQVCGGGHTYWSCETEAAERHGPRTCPRSGCGQTYSDCLNTPTSCVVGGYHASAPLSETVLELDSRFCPGGCGELLPTDHFREACSVCGAAYYTCTQTAAHAIIPGKHAPERFRCGHTYRLCAPGAHGQKQATCSTDPECIATDFWLCQHTSHIYAEDLPPGSEPPAVPSSLMCWNKHVYSPLDATAKAYHSEVKTCTRPRAEVWPDFLAAEKAYRAHAAEALGEPLTGTLGGSRYEWQYAQAWAFPEIMECFVTETDPEKRSNFVRAHQIVMGDLSVDHNRVQLLDGRAFRMRPNIQYVFRYAAEAGVGMTHRDETVYTPGAARPEVVIDVLNTSDAELERLSGWDFRINPITNQPFREQSR